VIRLLLAAGVALALSLVGTRFLIGWLTRHRVGQPIREDGPAGHKSKAGTPTMGGIAIVSSAVIGWLVSDLLSEGTFTRRGVIVVVTMTGAGLVGLLDDWLKVSRERNLGLNKRAKILGLLLVSTGFVFAALRFTHIATTVSLTRYDWPGIGMGKVIWALWAVTLILATSNAVNLTDGLDGLASMPVVIAAAAFAIIAYLVGNIRFADYLGVHHVPGSGELAVFCAALIGACLGFLWYNAPPAAVFMGDTGSLALGGALGSVAVITNHELVLVVIGGLFVLETVSVIVQVISFKTTGKRVFKMAPIHHHFEQLGWAESTVVIRFWIVSIVLALAGLATLKLR
jgi:phospho-N-acetylmuramoyl-pentapeptide-transferase